MSWIRYNYWSLIAVSARLLRQNGAELSNIQDTGGFTGRSQQVLPPKLRLCHRGMHHQKQTCLHQSCDEKEKRHSVESFHKHHVVIVPTLATFSFPYIKHGLLTESGCRESAASAPVRVHPALGETSVSKQVCWQNLCYIENKYFLSKNKKL